MLSLLSLADISGRVRGGPQRRPLNLRLLKRIGTWVFFTLCLAAIIAVALGWHPG